MSNMCTVSYREFIKPEIQFINNRINGTYNFSNFVFQLWQISSYRRNVDTNFYKVPKEKILWCYVRYCMLLYIQLNNKSLRSEVVILRMCHRSEWITKQYSRIFLYSWGYSSLFVIFNQHSTTHTVYNIKSCNLYFLLWIPWIIT